MKNLDVTSSMKICSPGRVNLIGEHTDYSFGYVMPMAINLYTYLEGNKDKDVALYSENLRMGGRFKIDDLRRENNWLDYVKGIYYILQSRGYRVGGMHGRIYGNLPIGSGLSSSASLELAILEFLKENYILNLKKMEMAIIAKEAENNYVGMPCGIMDQMAIVLGKKGYALFIDTENLSYEYIPFPKDLKILIFDTGIQRELAHSAYRERKQFISLILKKLGKHNSKSIGENELSKLSARERKMLGYVVRENQRVLKARDALKYGDIEDFGALLLEAHWDLANNYEVSCEELDFFVNKAMQHGALGARLTGAGFGGSAIAIFESIQDAGERIKREYEKRFMHQARYHIVKPAEGVRVCMH